MCRFARDGRHLANLVAQAVAVARRASGMLAVSPRRGRPPTFASWQIAVLIFIAIARRCKSKSSQYRFLIQHWPMLRPLLPEDCLPQKPPSRATYMRRYGGAYLLYEKMIEVGGRAALQEGVSDARTVAVDQSAIAAQGKPKARRRTRCVDLQAGWGKSAHDGWIWGYSYEAVVCACKNRPVLPILASVDRASVSSHRSFGPKIGRLPPGVRHVLGDSGYDNNDYAEAIECRPGGGRTGRRHLCPMQSRGGKPAVGRFVHKGRRERRRLHRLTRAKFFQSPRGRRLYAVRKTTIEPFHQWFKNLFDLQERVWHRGLDNNRTTLLACLFCYQLLERYNHALGHSNGQIQWILDGL